MFNFSIGPCSGNEMPKFFAKTGHFRNILYENLTKTKVKFGIKTFVNGSTVTSKLPLVCQKRMTDIEIGYQIENGKITVV
jgi:hypothetical protein